MSYVSIVSRRGRPGTSDSNISLFAQLHLIVNGCRIVAGDFNVRHMYYDKLTHKDPGAE